MSGGGEWVCQEISRNFLLIFVVTINFFVLETTEIIKKSPEINMETTIPGVTHQNSLKIT